MVRIATRSTPNKLTRPTPRSRAGISEMFESCLGCKWTLHVLAQIRQGVRRPGALERSAPGLTAKVLGERLTKLQRYNIIERRSFAEIPPRVEYSLTSFGRRFVKVLDQIEALKGELERE